MKNLSFLSSAEKGCGYLLVPVFKLLFLLVFKKFLFSKLHEACIKPKHKIPKERRIIRLSICLLCSKT